jgi:hypothetical protein
MPSTIHGNFVTAASPDNSIGVQMEDNDRRNPYINYDDNSVPNIIDMTEFSQ